jgi:hypothetical protein
VHTGTLPSEDEGMLHGLVCSLVVLVVSGCASSMSMQAERSAAGLGQSASLVGLTPMIRGPHKGTGLVLGLTVPFDIGARTSADESSGSVSSSTRMLSMVSGKTPAQLQSARQQLPQR